MSGRIGLKDLSAEAAAGTLVQTVLSKAPSCGVQTPGPCCPAQADPKAWSSSIVVLCCESEARQEPLFGFGFFPFNKCVLSSDYVLGDSRGQPRSGCCSLAAQGPGQGCPVGCNGSQLGHAVLSARPWHPASWALITQRKGTLRG